VLEGKIIEGFVDSSTVVVRSASKALQEGVKSAILEVFKEWSLLLHADSEINAQREKIIRGALRHNSVEKLKKAIRGCTLTPFYMDQNFTQLKHILKDQDTIDMFVKNADKPPRIPINPNNKDAVRHSANQAARQGHEELKRKLDERAARLREKEIGEERNRKKEELDASVCGEVARIE
jgi:hypothetical protein